MRFYYVHFNTIVTDGDDRPLPLQHPAPGIRVFATSPDDALGRATEALQSLIGAEMDGDIARREAPGSG